MDLVYAASKIRNVTHCNTTLGERGILATRLQPNHPSDDPDGIRMSLFEGLSYASGDAVIGINPATTNLDTTRRIMHMLQEVKDKYQIPTQVCYLVHVSTMMGTMRNGSPSDLIFASIAGTPEVQRYLRRKRGDSGRGQTDRAEIRNRYRPERHVL